MKTYDTPTHTHPEEREGEGVLLFQLAQEERRKWQVHKYALIHCLEKHESDILPPSGKDYLFSL